MKKWIVFLLQIFILFIFSCSDDISKTEQIFEKVRIEYSKCTGCNECITDFSCPENAIKIDSATNTNYIDMTKCVGCMKCVDVFDCRFDAFTVEKDIKKPSSIIDLTSKSVTDTSITFKWSAPSDDGDSLGRAFKYIIKFSKDSIIDENWNNYPKYPVSFIPTDFPYTENLSIGNLTPQTKYFIAIKSIDESNNISQISNICSETTLKTPDLTPPSPITNLESTVSTDSISLVWTSPGDDGNIGTATKYIIKISTDSITNDNWDSISEYPNNIIPKKAGNTENFIIENLISQTKYFIGIKSVDEIGNLSLLSNITENTIPIIEDIIAPSTIENLSSSSNIATIISLTWTSPGDDGNIGASTKYIIKVSTDSITNDNWNSISEYQNSITPKEAGNTEYFDIKELNSQTKYFVGVKSMDEVGNISLLSNIIKQTTPVAEDDIPPSTIANLSSTATEAIISLTWTSPGDDGNIGTATKYIIKVSTDSITNDNWNSISEYQNSIIPKEAGNTEYFDIAGLSEQTKYFFGIKAMDEAGNISLLSNIVSNSLQGDIIAPLAVTDLSITEGSTNSLTEMELTWMATGDDGNVGTASSYIIKYSQDPITEANFETAITVSNSITPLQAGSQETFVVTGLTKAEIYYFAIKVVDDAGNASLISNNTSGKTVYQILPNRCNGCGRCVYHCPENAITIPSYDAVIDPDKCTACGTCVSWCPRSAIIKTVIKYQ